MDISDTSDQGFAIEPFLERQECTWLLPFPGMDKSGEEICKLFKQGRCPHGKACPFRHTLGEKRVVCKHWLRSLCKKGDDCDFLHQFDPSKMPECYFFSTHKVCTNEECLFLHIDPESKKKDCAWYARGFCKHGPECRNRHKKLTICPHYLYGFCPLGPACKLAHPPWEIPTSNTIDPETNKPSVITAGDSGQSDYKKKIKCHTCGQMGHKASECNQHRVQTLQPTANPGGGGSLNAGLNVLNRSFDGSGGGGVVCHNCGAPGHIRPKCPLLNGGQVVTEVTCYKCNQKGHLANQCPQRGQFGGGPPLAPPQQYGGGGGGGKGMGMGMGGAPPPLPPHHFMQQQQQQQYGGYR